MKERGPLASSTRTGPLPSDRYRFEAALGQGGMATVHRALDLETGRPVAFKRLRPEALESSQGAVVGLFEREYLTLSQLAHPRVVSVFDYGVDEAGPYYTMELLDGGDLQQLAPLPWLKACQIARDVCSALALLHSRRMVYRDLSPRNVRCTTDGLAKLIDFGAMTPMGLTRELAGTAPCVAPEALNLQALDARTDLFALGATLYFALVQRHAYPARDLSQLRDVWRSRPRRPSELVAGIPPALDQLVMDLLQLDASLRPANAAEVMARLAAICGSRASEQLIVAQSYLSNPTLIGRQAQLTIARKFTWKALSRRGGSLLIRGAPGVGRSRLLDACVLEAKLAGLLVVRIEAREMNTRSEFAIAASIGLQLIESARVVALSTAEEHLPVLGKLIPGLEASAEVGQVSEAPELGRHGQLALHAWLAAFARKRPLLIAVDDFNALDERSAGFLALLAERAGERGILLAVTLATGEEPSTLRAARELLASASTEIPLESLTREESEQLLESVFGDVPNLPALANYVHGVASGNPRDTMQLAQQIVNDGLILYSGGAWSLPDRLRLNALPATMSEALSARVAKLGRAEHELALAFALEPSLRFSFEECVALARTRDARAVFQELEELVLENVCVSLGSSYALKQQAWIAPLLEAATREQRDRAHAALGEVLCARSDALRAASHLFSCGQAERGIELLLAFAVATTHATSIDANAFFKLLDELPPDWLATFERALEFCKVLGRPACDTATLLDRMEGIIAHAISDNCGYHHIQARLDQLNCDCGLDLYAAMDGEQDATLRMKRAFQAAQARYDAMAQSARSEAPMIAVKELSQSVITAVGAISFTHDAHAFERLPALAPLAALFPPMTIVRDLVDGVGARIRGQNERAIAIYERLLAGPFAAPSATVGRSHQHTARLRLGLSIATMEAAMGVRRALERLPEVEAEPAYAAQAMLARQLYFVWQGDAAEAERCKRQAEVLLIQSNSHHGFEGQHLFGECCAFALADDLTRVKRAADAIEARAHTHRAWLPMMHYGRGEYQRIRGDHAAALAEFEKALSRGGAGAHPIWANIAGAQLRVLGELGRHAEAVALGASYLQHAERSALGYGRSYIAMPYSIALAELERHEEAIAVADSVVAEFQALGATGLNLALAYETRARVALRAGDRIGFDELQKRAVEQWPAGEKRLRGAFETAHRDSDHDELGVYEELSVLSQFASQLETCGSAEQRARCGLEYLVAQSGALSGLLYRYTNEGLAHVATSANARRTDELDEWAAAYFRRELDEDGDEDEAELPDIDRERLMPVLLMHQTSGGLALSGLALLLVEPGAPYNHPARVAGELSRYLVEYGDAVVAES